LHNWSNLNKKILQFSYIIQKRWTNNE